MALRNLLGEFTKAGGDINAKDKEGWTALHLASYFNFPGRDECLTQLFELGADVNATTDDKMTAVMLAVLDGDATVVDRLLSVNADCNIQDRLGFAPLHHAAAYGRFLLVKKLVERGADTQVLAKDGQSPLHCAARTGSQAMVEFLLENGALVEARTKAGENAEQIARSQGFVDLANYLQSMKGRIPTPRRNLSQRINTPQRAVPSPQFQTPPPPSNNNNNNNNFGRTNSNNMINNNNNMNNGINLNSNHQMISSHFSENTPSIPSSSSSASPLYPQSMLQPMPLTAPPQNSASAAIRYREVNNNNNGNNNGNNNLPSSSSSSSQQQQQQQNVYRVQQQQQHEMLMSPSHQQQQQQQQQQQLQQQQQNYQQYISGNNNNNNNARQIISSSSAVPSGLPRGRMGEDVNRGMIPSSSSSASAAAGGGGGQMLPPPPPSGPPPQQQQQQQSSSASSNSSNNSAATSSPSQFEWEIDFATLRFGKHMGSGSFGEVYKGLWLGSPVAIKTLKIGKAGLDPQTLKDFRSEIDIMSKMRHVNVVLFVGACTVLPNLTIVTEFCPRGSLYDVIRTERDLDWPRKLRICAEAAAGMLYLHTRNPPIVHRDVKSDNFLVSADYTVKVCDFGLARFRTTVTHVATTHARAGTPAWMAPEVLRGEPFNESSDVYGFGVVLWELLTHAQPWAEVDPVQLPGLVGFRGQRLALPPTPPPGCPSSFLLLMKDCWEHEPRRRPKFFEIQERLQMMAEDASPTRMVSRAPRVDVRPGYPQQQLPPQGNNNMMMGRRL